jgi:hypothetical protein
MIQKTLIPITSVFLDARSRPSSQVAFRYNDGSRWCDIAWPEYYKMAERVIFSELTLSERPDKLK